MEEIKEVGDLIRKVKDFSKLPSFVIYRGQNEGWPLLPKLFREDKKTNLRIERELFDRLVLNKPLLPAGIIDPFDYLIFAQQHSMPSRLLDWTESPIVALWFACFNQVNDFSKDGYLYIYNPIKLVDAKSSFADQNIDFIEYLHNNLNEIQKLKPSPYFERIISQSGLFTVFPNDLEIKETEIRKIKIPSSSKESILKELGKLNFNEYTIFRDYDSFCKNLYWEVKRDSPIIGKEEKRELPYIGGWD